jgi:hypothetical protein
MMHIFLFFVSGLLLAQSPEAQKLTRIRLAAQRNLTRLPNFTCLETIERSRRRLPARKHDLIDIARVEVALVQGKELFAWPGSGKFDDRELRDMIPGGATGNGSFALHARAIFLGRHTTFDDLGDSTLDGKPVHRYSYNVPQPFSGFTIRNGDRQAVVGYKGEFFIDKSNLDLLKLVVLATELPVELEISDHAETLTYQRVTIGDSDYLLPQGSDMMLTGEGVENRNRTTFSGCKQYGVASTISFDAPEEGSPEAVALAAKIAEPRPPIDGGLEVEIDLPSMQLGKTAVGDPIVAKVARDAKKDKQVVIPKGSSLKGRVIYLERFGETRVGSQYVDRLYLALDFEEVVAKDWKAPLAGTVKGLANVVDSRMNSRLNADYGALVPGGHPSGHNVLVVYNDLRLRSGLRLIWETRSGPLKPAASPR